MLLTLLALTVTPELPELLSKTAEAERAQFVASYPYTYSELQENWDGDSDAKPRTRRFQNLFVEGRPYRKLVERNGKQLSAGEQKKVEQELQRAAQRRREERRQEKRGRKAPFLPGTRYFGIGTFPELVHLFDFRFLGEERLDGGQQTFVIEGEAKPDLASRRPDREELLCYRQKFWIHATEFVVLKREVHVIRTGAELLPGTVLTSEFAQPEAGYPRFEVRRQIDFTTKVFGVRTVRGRQVHSFSDFRKFDVESSITFDAEPSSP